jgi:hypothetical protein
MSTKRLQVLFEEEELAEIQRFAEARQQPVASWVRGVLREAMARETTADVRPKLEALRTAMAYEFPAPPIEQMVAEIEAGYGRTEE